MEGDSARVEELAFFGSIEIQVPPDWAVTSKVATLIGGFSDKPHPAAAVPSKELIVDGIAIVGGIEVKSCWLRIFPCDGLRCCQSCWPVVRPLAPKCGWIKPKADCPTAGALLGIRRRRTPFR